MTAWSILLTGSVTLFSMGHPVGGSVLAAVLVVTVVGCAYLGGLACPEGAEE